MSGLARLAIGVAILAAVATTAAAEPAIIIDLKPRRLDRALVALAAQLGVSLGGDLAACGTSVRGLRGRYTPSAAFGRLIEQAPCEVLPLDDRSFIVRARAAAPRVALSGSRRLETKAPSTVDSVVVTADRRRQAAWSFAGSISVVASRALDAAGKPDVQSLSALIPELTSTNLGPGRDKLFLRGVSDGAFAGSALSTVAIYMDDLPITYNAPDPALRLVDIDRVEVVSGPEGALYGAGAIGGVVRILPTAPDPARLSGRLEASMSTTARGGAGADAALTLNAPVLPDRLAIRANVYSERDGGWINVANGPSNVNSTQRDGGRLSILARLTPEWSLSLGGAYQDLNNADSQYVFGTQRGLSRPERVSEPHDNDFSFGSLSLAGPTRVGDFKLSAAIINHGAQTRYDATDALALISPRATGRGADDESHARMLGFGEATLRSRSERPFRWLAGVFLAHSSDHFANAITRLDEATPSAPPLYREARHDVQDEQALFGELSWEAGSHLTARAGARLFRSTSLTDSALSGFLTSSDLRKFEGRTTTTGTSPHLALQYRPSADLFIYAQVSTGYRPRTFNTSGLLGQSYDSLGYPPRIVKPDSIRTVEAGLRWAPTSNLRLFGAVYDTEWLNVQSDQFSNVGLNYTLNLGDAVIRGLQLGSSASVGEFSLDGSLLLQTAELKPEPPTSIVPQSEVRLPIVPDLSTSLQVSWKRNWGPQRRIEVQFGARYDGRSTLTFDGGGSRAGFATMTGAIIFDLGRWRGSLSGENLTNSTSDTFAFGNPFIALRSKLATPLRPRTLKLEVMRSF